MNTTPFDATVISAQSQAIRNSMPFDWQLSHKRNGLSTAAGLPLLPTVMPLKRR